jgi:hypothetical protein
MKGKGMGNLRIILKSCERLAELAAAALDKRENVGEGRFLLAFEAFRSNGGDGREENAFLRQQQRQLVEPPQRGALLFRAFAEKLKFLNQWR